jgi:hypothetical protein
MDWVKVSAVLNIIRFFVFITIAAVLCYFLIEHKELVTELSKGFNTFFSFFSL